MKLIKKRQFVATALSPNKKIILVHIAIFSSDPDINLFYKAQLASLFAVNTLTVIFFQYANFANIFSSKSTVKLSEYTEMNNYRIDLGNS